MRGSPGAVCSLVVALVLTGAVCRSASVAYSYDALGRLTRVTYSDGTTIAYAYDSAGNRLSQIITNGGVATPSGSNLAQGKSATQSSTLAGYPAASASSAVDGNTDGSFFHGSVTATNPDTNAWWQVDLGASASVSSVVVWNRTDCCSSRLGDYWVFVSDTPFGPTDTSSTLQSRAGTWGSHQTTAPNPSSNIAAAGTQGRYVRVQLTGADTLSLAEVQVFGTMVTIAPSATDLAQGKSATQSSTLAGYPAAGANSAVDGNTDGSFFDGSVTATNTDANAWWQVDLGASTAVGSIVIWNRTDCCASRLNDYWVFVSDTPFGPTDSPSTLQFRAGTWASHQTVAPSPSTTIAAGAQGRYVRVQLTGANNLSLAEVQVFGPGTPAASNLAQGRTATQSSTLAGVPSAGAGSAVDGSTDGSFFDGSVTATNADTNAWWQVDLGASAAIGSITIWNRTDCCGSRLNDYWVFVSDTPFGPTDTPATLQFRSGTWASHETSAPNPSTSIVAATEGRYVRVQLTGTNYLSLAEVQVFGPGASVAPAATNLAQSKSAAQSSTLAGYAAAGAIAAVDGNTDGKFFDGSVSTTNLDANAWWQVDLGASTAIGSIVVWNRTDCCGSRLGDYWVFVSDTPFGSADTPATLQNRPGMWSSHQTTAPNPSTTIGAGTQGRYVRVQLTGADYLSLAEVQVFAPGTNLALGKAATQSSTLPGYSPAAAASAVDGSTDGAFFDGSVTATNADANAWWQVDLGASASVSSIAVWNRTDCCGSRLSDYWVFVSDTPFSSADTPATLQFRAGTWGSHQTTAPSPSATIAVGAQGRYVRVQLTGTTYLSLAEVQVFGQ